MARIPFLFALLIAGFVQAASPKIALAQGLVADLSSHLIAITTDFTGKELLMFGTLEDPNVQDIIVVVQGPSESVTVRQKEEILGVWINRSSTTFEQVPSFYRVASSKPLEEIMAVRDLDRAQIGLRHLKLVQAPGGTTFREALETFQDAFIRRQVGRNLYGSDVSAIRFVGGRLFRTTIAFPANVPTGQFIVTAYLIENGVIMEAQTTPLVVSKTGLGADVATFAYRSGFWYGIVAVIIAIVAGYSASWVFRRL